MLWQLSINALITGGALSIMAISFSLIYDVSRFFHFAHGVVFTAGAYFTFLFNVWLGLPLFVSILLAIVLSSLLGCAMEVSIYRPLVRKGASSLILLLASLGIYISLQNFISMLFGDDIKTIRIGMPEEGINILGAKVTPVQLLTLFVSIALLTVVTVVLRKIKIGKAMRAVANDAALANIYGVDSNKVIMCVFAMGSALAGAAGILMALDVDITLNPA